MYAQVGDINVHIKLISSPPPGALQTTALPKKKITGLF
jgi:hypothetical protein